MLEYCPGAGASWGMGTGAMEMEGCLLGYRSGKAAYCCAKRGSKLLYIGAGGGTMVGGTKTGGGMGAMETPDRAIRTWWGVL